MNRNLTMQTVADGRFGRGAALCTAWRCVARIIRAIGCLLLIVAAFVAVKPSVRAQDMPLDYQVKAAFLVNFPKYVDWPANVFADANSPITVAIMGDDNVADEFRVMIEGGKVINGRAIVLKRISKEEEIGPDCHILYISGSEKHRTAAVLNRVKGTPILTVGETDDFLDKGGVINLVRRDRKIRLQVNLNAARDAQLKISSRLLIVADRVEGAPN